MRRPRIDYRHWLCLALCLSSAALCIFVYRYPLIRFWESLSAFGRSFAFSVLDLLDLSEAIPIAQTVNEYSNVNIAEIYNVSFEELQRKLSEVWPNIFVGIHFQCYCIYLLWHLTRFMMYACMAGIVLLIVAIPIILSWDETNNDYNEDTLPLHFFKRYVAIPLRKIYHWCKEFSLFFRGKPWWGIFILIWLLNIGIFNILISFLAYYFWVLTAFDLSTIGIQMVKLAGDVLLGLHTLPFPVWIILALIFYQKWRKSIAIKKLQHKEAQNKGLLNAMSMCMFTVAPPRTGKTTLNTSMALSFTALFRYKALELMQGNMLKYPNFPWILFERELQNAIKEHTVYNLFTCREWVTAYRACYEAEPMSANIWNYNVMTEPTEYNDGLTVKSIWDALSNYAQEYFIYFLQTSIILSNYAIREDFVFCDKGNFPLVDTDFFKRDPAKLPSISTHSHVIDYDMLRLGQKINRENPNLGGLEFGVIIISEIDKERKNDLRLRELKIKDENQCTQKNDLFNEWIKMAGQSAMVENFCFLRIISDAQRPSSWGADARELCTVMHLQQKGEPCNALPFYWLEDALLSKYLSWWQSVWVNSRFKWGNNRLITWLGQGLAAKLYGYRVRCTNQFGYYHQSIQTESGTLEKENLEEYRYAILRKKDFSDRFATDHFKSYSQVLTEECQVGLNDIPAYNSIYPTFEEMIIQNSHFCKELSQYFNIQPAEPEKEED